MSLINQFHKNLHFPKVIVILTSSPSSISILSIPLIALCPIINKFHCKSFSVSHSILVSLLARSSIMFRFLTLSTTNPQYSIPHHSINHYHPVPQPILPSPSLCPFSRKPLIVSNPINPLVASLFRAPFKLHHSQGDQSWSDSQYHNINRSSLTTVPRSSF